MIHGPYDSFLEIAKQKGTIDGDRERLFSYPSFAESSVPQCIRVARCRASFCGLECFQYLFMIPMRCKTTLSCNHAVFQGCPSTIVLIR